ncbi:ATP synthase subunit s, mitochondrial isoform X1 [Fundulus heteroclitus]|uniref:ATP synthase subunit s, mitochondrial isoform X1 n=1 Tax=Fundulus heteroclitus TaxID=8078 RepID=UPI00165A5699|nr:ATP synthase subunit s, mitochondrial isoform X1 [Fundulus heteroclitus]XP_021177043.2 ATP synthase subunit s, mitochondrial isoform X1 [Fundulus heteroclitus]
MGLLSRAVQSAARQREASRRRFWGWLNAVFNAVDNERIKAVGPDRAAAEWLLRCGAKVRFEGFDRWHHDYNGLPTGSLGRYKIQAIDATESCIMNRGFDYLDGLKFVEEIKFNKCVYIEDVCMERLSSMENLQASLYMMEVVSCGNVTDKGILALHKLRNLEYLFLSDLPGIKDRQMTVDRLQRALPRLDIALDLD